jgi:D-psicose/D-tagatose/L-ribulose 3-epimerase
MKFSISNIAWEPAEDLAVMELLNQYRFDAIEIAPTKIWNPPTDIAATEVDQYRARWEGNGYPIVAMQSLLFNRSDLTIFDNDESRANLSTYLRQMIDLASSLGVKRMVFGSPKNRLVGERSANEINEIAIPFFRNLGEYAFEKGTVFCIEPNPPQYGCDYITNTAEGVELVRSVNHPGFRLHLDTAAMTLNEENYADSIELALPYTAHFHISEPFLELVQGGRSDHRTVAEVLNSISYEGYVSIEMKNNLLPSNIEAVDRALSYISSLYRVGEENA